MLHWHLQKLFQQHHVNISPVIQTGEVCKFMAIISLPLSPLLDSAKTGSKLWQASEIRHVVAGKMLQQSNKS